MSKTQADYHCPLTDAYFYLSGYQQRSCCEGRNASSFHPRFPALGNHCCSKSQNSPKGGESVPRQLRSPGTTNNSRAVSSQVVLLCFPHRTFFGGKRPLGKEVLLSFFPPVSGPVQKEMPNPDPWGEFEGTQQTSQNWGHIFKDLSSLLLTSQPPKNILFLLLNTFFNLKDKYFLHLPRLFNVSKRLKVTNRFLPAFQASLPEGLHFPVTHFPHRPLQLSPAHPGPSAPCWRSSRLVLLSSAVSLS